MKRFFVLLILLCILCGCAADTGSSQIAATTLPVYEFTSRLCQGTGITVTRLITESVSCLHDYSLQVSQMRALESAQWIVINGGGLEDFLHDALHDEEQVLDASAGMELLCPETEHSHEHDDHGHHHDQDPHLWLSPVRAAQMASNICEGLCAAYPVHETLFRENLTSLLQDLQDLQAYGEAELGNLSCRELVTFHDGFAYLAESFGLTVLEAVEEESGSEASAAELIHLIGIIQAHRLPAIFTETNGSTAAAQTIAAETGICVYSLDMVMAGDSYFEAMYRNIDTLKEALG